MRARPLKGRPPLRMVTSRDELAIKLFGISPHFQLSLSPSINITSFSYIGSSGIHLSRGSGIKYRKSDRYTRFPLLLWCFLLFTILGRWLITSASCPPCPLPEDFHALCPRLSLPEAEGALADFELPEMVQVTFYAILLNKAVELGVVHSFIAEGLKSALVG
ncbi:hypothetical protein Cgig2_020624 [Carnegiea gigantea]|uniref:Uncharacterized protein n=1 Tax=Carnegiea gigantea TaxID=171969 RepID=A0A9Q1JY04_9CARY|nr:hypothetical protein Cgig2_020624 [Carnegiea gigantea]